MEARAGCKPACYNVHHPGRIRCERAFLSAGATVPSKACASGDNRPSASTTNGTIGVAGDLSCRYLERLERTMSTRLEPQVELIRELRTKTFSGTSSTRGPA